MKPLRADPRLRLLLGACTLAGEKRARSQFFTAEQWGQRFCIGLWAMDKADNFHKLPGYPGRPVGLSVVA
jgi:hypothetical protein